jgi:hypothetical protein
MDGIIIYFLKSHLKLTLSKRCSIYSSVTTFDFLSLLLVLTSIANVYDYLIIYNKHAYYLKKLIQYLAWETCLRRDYIPGPTC